MRIDQTALEAMHRGIARHNGCKLDKTRTFLVRSVLDELSLLGYRVTRDPTVAPITRSPA